MNIIEHTCIIYIDVVDIRPVTYENVMEDRYYISNFGDVYSTAKGPIKQKMNPIISESGEAKITLTTTEGKRLKVTVARLVAHEFCEGYRKELVAGHKDGNNLNNHFRNLEWVSKSDIAKRSYEKGRIPIGNRIQARKHSEKTIHKICELLQEGLKPNDIANVLNDHIEEELSYSVIHGIARHIHNRKSWKHIAKDYVW